MAEEHGPASPTGMPVTTGIRPVTDDRDTAGFFAAAGRGVLVIRRCNSCEAAIHLPVPRCPHCQSDDGRWEPAGATGTLYSWTVADHQVHPAFPVPYTIILVELDDLPGVRVCGRLDGAPDIRVGQPVRVRFDPVGEGAGLPNWELL